MDNQYCDVNNAFSNNGILNTNDLEKLARQINNNKKIKSKDVYNKYRDTSIKLDNSAHEFQKMIISQADKGTKIMPYHINGTMGQNDFNINVANVPKKDTRRGAKQPINGFFSAQGDYAEFKNTESSNDSDYKIKSDAMSGSDGIILDTPSDTSSSDNSNSSSNSDSSSSWNAKKIDKHIKSKSKFNNKKRSKRHKCMDFDLDSIDSLESLESGESLLRHIRICIECKEKVMNLIKKHKYDKKSQHIMDNINISDHKTLKDIIQEEIKENKKSDINDNKDHTKNIVTENTNNNSFISYFNISQMKEIIIICLVGFLIIIVLDLIMNR